MRSHFILIFIFSTMISATEKITADYDEAVKYCHEQKSRLPNIWELKYWWKSKKLSFEHSFWSSTCAVERPGGKGWDYYQGDCVKFAILDGQGHARCEEPNSPEVKVVYCVKGR